MLPPARLTDDGLVGRRITPAVIGRGHAVVEEEQQNTNTRRRGNIPVVKRSWNGKILESCSAEGGDWLKSMTIMREADPGVGAIIARTNLVQDGNKPGRWAAL